MRKYNYLIVKVYYPLEHGYRMEHRPLPDWIHIHIVDHDNSKRLIVHSRLHVNKPVEVGPMYSTDFNDHEIIKDLSAKISTRFLN